MFKISQKGFSSLLIILGIVLLTGLLAGSYYLGVQNNSTKKEIIKTEPAASVPPATIQPAASPSAASTNSFISTDKNFSFNYPPNMEVTEINNVSPDIQNFHIQTRGWSFANATSAESYQIEVTYLKNNPYTSQQFMDLDKKSEGPTPEASYRQTTINGANAVEKTYSDQSSFAWGGQKEYYIYNEKYGVMLRGSGKNHNLLDDIAASFKLNN